LAGRFETGPYGTTKDVGNGLAGLEFFGDDGGGERDADGFEDVFDGGFQSVLLLLVGGIAGIDELDQHGGGSEHEFDVPRVIGLHERLDLNPEEGDLVVHFRRMRDAGEVDFLGIVQHLLIEREIDVFGFEDFSRFADHLAASIFELRVSSLRMGDETREGEGQRRSWAAA
jgi:hypothetical protein